MDIQGKRFEKFSMAIVYSEYMKKYRIGFFSFLVFFFFFLTSCSSSLDKAQNKSPKAGSRVVASKEDKYDVCWEKTFDVYTSANTFNRKKTKFCFTEKGYLTASKSCSNKSKGEVVAINSCGSNLIIEIGPFRDYLAVEVWFGSDLRKGDEVCGSWSHRAPQDIYSPTRDSLTTITTDGEYDSFSEAIGELCD